MGIWKTFHLLQFTQSGVFPEAKGVMYVSTTGTWHNAAQ